MRTFLTLAIALAVLSGPAVAAGPSPERPAPAPAKPRLGPWGVALTAMDRRVKPGDDFFRFVNGGWYDTYAFKPDETYAGARAGLYNQLQARVLDLIQTASRDPAEKGGVAAAVGALYASYMDAERLDRLGVTPLAKDLARIRAIGTPADLVRAFARAPLDNGASPFMGSTFYDFHAPGRIRYTLTPGGLGLPSRETYLDASPAAQKVRADYLAYVEAMLRFAGEPDAAKSAQAILDLETRLAAAQWPSTDASDFLKTANDQTPAELKAEAPGFDWDLFLREAGADGLDVLIVRQPSAMAGLVAEVNRTPLAVWRAWLAYHLVSRNAEYLSSPIARARFDFYERRLGGQDEPSPRWNEGVGLVQTYLGQAVGKLYVQRYFADSSKDQVAAIFANVRAVMRERLELADWMSPSTRAEALRKIDILTVKIGYPTKWPSFSDLRFDPTDLYGNLRQARRHHWAERMAMVRAPIDPQAWLTTAQTTGAAANPNLNEITVPAGALEPPFFDAAADPAVNYGAIGAVMGHELSHMFDQVGRRMDATGALRDWWAPQDAARYEEIAKKVEAEYDAFEALPGHRVSGKFTLNENIADISGLSLALDAYRRAQAGRPGPVLDGFTGEQRVFLGWAQMRAGKMRDARLIEALRSDPHAPDIFRVNGVVSNIDGWYEAFGVKPGDALYRAPADRARFW